VSSFLLWSRAFPGRCGTACGARRERLEQIRPQNGRLPALRAQERLRVLDAGWKAPRGKALETRSCHQTLTKVVVETDAACDEIAVELLAVAPQAQQQSQDGAVAIAGGAVAIAVAERGTVAVRAGAVPGRNE